MAVFKSLFYEGAIPAKPTQADIQRVYPCDINISDGLIDIDYFSTFDKKVKLGSYSMKIDEAEIVEKKSVNINIMVVTLNAPTVVIKNNSSVFTLVDYGDYPGKKLMGKKAQTANLDEITTAIFKTKHSEPSDSKPESNLLQVDDTYQLPSNKRFKIKISKKKIIALIVAGILAGIVLGVAISNAFERDRTADIYDDNGNGRYDPEDVFGENYEGWLEFADTLD